MSAQVVFDIEANGLRDADKVWCIASKDLSDNPTSSWDVERDNILEGLKYLSSAGKLIGHNIINYDLPTLKAIHNWEPSNSQEILDTLILSRLSNPDRRKPWGYTGTAGPHSLECWGYRVAKKKPVHEDWTVFSDEMLHRCKSDVVITEMVLQFIESEMDGYDWSEAIELEHNVMRIMTQQELNGVYFDKHAAIDLVRDLTNSIDSIDSELVPNLPIYYKPRGVSVSKPFKANGQYSKMVLDWYPDLEHDSLNYVGGPFTRVEGFKLDIGSISQIKNYFLEQGWIPTEYNYSKKTGQPTSPKLTEDSYSTITGGMGPQIKDRLTLAHRRSQIQGWIDRVRSDGRLSACANTCGTPTGRMRHSNVVNVPKAADYVPYGKEMRALFTVPKGYKLVGCDADQLELRLLAHFMGDFLYIQEILHGDIHTHNQTLAGLPTRDDAKTFIYAFIYGAGDEKLGSIVGGDSTDGKRLREAFLKGLPDLNKLIKRVKRAANKGWLKGLDGRKLFLRRSENGEVMKHKALNLYIQGAGAIVMKKAMIILDGLIKDNPTVSTAKKVLDMHDEFQFEVVEKESKALAELCEKALVLAGKSFDLRIPIEGTAKIGNNWAETH